MTTRAARRSWVALGTLLMLIAGVYVTALTLTETMLRSDQSAVLMSALTVDMVVLVPLAWYLLAVRWLGMPILTLLPVLVLGTLAASALIPSQHQQALRVLEGGVALAEVALITWIVIKVVRSVKQGRAAADVDPLARLQQIATAATGRPRAGAAIASELAIFFYGLGSWRRQAHAPAGTTAFTHHRRSAMGAIVFALMMVMVAEGIGVHFLLSLWSRPAAWLLTALTVYGGLWLLADYRATVLRPILVAGDRVLFRAGLRWTLEVARRDVVRVGTDRPDVGRRETLNLGLLAQPKLWVELARPVQAQGAYGFRRQVRAVGLAPDDENAFLQALSAD